MYLIKLCEFIDARMSMMVLGKEQDGIQNQLCRWWIFITGCLPGHCNREINSMHIMKKCMVYRNLNVAVFENLEYFLWYEDEPVFLMQKSFHEVFRGYTSFLAYKITIQDVYSRASQLMSLFIKKQCKIYEHGMILHIVCGDRDMDSNLCSSSIRILLRYACFLALYELCSAEHSVWFINPFVKLSADQAGIVLNQINETHKLNNRIVLLYSERYASNLHRVL